MGFSPCGSARCQRMSNHGGSAPGPPHFPPFANGMEGEQGTRRMSRRRRSPGWGDTASPAIMLLAQCAKCSGVWGRSPQEHSNIRRRHPQFGTEIGWRT